MSDYLKKRERERKLEKIRGKAQRRPSNGDAALATVKGVTARIVRGLKTGIGKGTKVTTTEARATLPRGWDKGFHVPLKIELPNGEQLGGVMTLYAAEGDASGNITLDADYGGVIATARSDKIAPVLSTLIAATAVHLKRA